MTAKTIGTVVVASLCRQRGSVSVRGEYDDLPPSQIGYQVRQSIHVILGPAIEDGDVVTLDIAGFLQAQVKCAHAL